MADVAVGCQGYGGVRGGIWYVWGKEMRGEKNPGMWFMGFGVDAMEFL